MKIGVLGDIFSLKDNRGISRVVTFLFSEISRLYPDIEIYMFINLSMGITFKEKNKIIIKDITEIETTNLDFLVFPSNGNGCDYYYNSKYNFKIVSIIHDIIPVLMSDNKEDLSTIQTTSNINSLNYYKNIIDNSDLILTGSEHTKKDIINYLNVSKPITALSWSYMLSKIEEEEYIGNTFFLYNGGYDYRKGIFQMVENFLQLKMRDKIESSLVLTGKISSYFILNDKLSFLIDYGKKHNWIIDKGFVSDEELSSLYSNAVAMIYPSSYEGFGLPLVEAMHLGCPIITTRVSSIPEICGDAAYYIDRNNEDEFQKAFIEMEKNLSLRNSLIKNGLKNIKNFSWEKTAHEFIDLLKNNI